MKEWLTFVAGNAVTLIHAMALVVVLIGTVQAFGRSFRAMVNLSASGQLFSNCVSAVRALADRRADFSASRGHHRIFDRAKLGLG